MSAAVEITPVPLPTIDWKNPDYNPVFAERIARLTRIRESTENLIPGLKAFYKTHPIEFIGDWGCTFDPRNVEVKLPPLVPFLLFPKQKEFVQWLWDRWMSREDGLVEKSRDMGVSWLSVAFAVWAWLFYPGVVFGFGSRKEIYVDDLEDPKALFPKIRQFIQFLPEEFRPVGWDEKRDAPYMKILNPENGAVMFGEAGNNIGRGARASMYFVDESAFIEHQDVVDAALSQTTNCKIDLSSVNGAGNAFYRKRHSGKVKVFVFDWRDDPRKGQDWYQKQLGKLDAVIVASEIDRNYEGSVHNAFIPADRVIAAMRKGPADVIPHGGLRVGVDVARFGDDKCSIVFRRGRVMLKKVTFGKLDVVQVASRVRVEVLAFREEPEQIAIDVVNMGAGVADICRGWWPDSPVPRTGKTKKIVVDVNASLRMKNGQHYNLRAFMWSEMREWLLTGSMPNDDDMKTQMTSIQYSYKGGELLLESKDDAKARGVKSPDDADALSFTFAYPTIPEKTMPKVPPRPMLDTGCGMLG